MHKTDKALYSSKKETEFEGIHLGSQDSTRKLLNERLFFCRSGPR